MDKRSGNGHSQFPASPERGETTGRYVVIFREDDVPGGVRSLSRSTGVSLASTKDAERTAYSRSAENVLFAEVGAAIVSLKADEFRKLKAMKEADSSIIAIEPERYVYSLQGPHEPRASVRQPSLSGDYLRGYRDGATSVLNQFVGVRDGELFPKDEAAEALAWDESKFTWGLQATHVDRSNFSGRGVRIAVLDTGGLSTHPDFEGRKLLSRSFIEDEEAEDMHGHGTHCSGTAAGPKEPRSGPRYGIAFEAELLIGKVLNNQGSGVDGSVVAGMNWALEENAHIISMSLGSSVGAGGMYNPVYEELAVRALRRGCLIIAAAGNEFGQPVGSPANCPSILSVGALDEQLQPASFSSLGHIPNGGEVNIAAPGVNVLSAWSHPGLYRRLNGTSMATPHVAGIAALWLEKTGAKGLALWRQLERAARPLSHHRQSVGAGLVQAP